MLTKCKKRNTVLTASMQKEEEAKKLWDKISVCLNSSQSQQMGTFLRSCEELHVSNSIPVDAYQKHPMLSRQQITQPVWL
jgi:hypothetical protein